jgi:hypothetical protein
MYNSPSIYQQLSDSRADLVQQFQYARKCSNGFAMRQACKDIMATDKMLREELCLEF